MQELLCIKGPFILPSVDLVLVIVDEKNEVNEVDAESSPYNRSIDIWNICDMVSTVPDEDDQGCEGL
ncbi:hypothetical protein AAES_132763 [Amazona aestiva]|uniref:Uncharacterized protein n=1 Tax=Amazona aestiva TaxID=12930 RepID=A0A0Q3M1Y5_AMAAE|nr:hypothetical protein AAES_132763 [Amazona aestiva]